MFNVYCIIIYIYMCVGVCVSEIKCDLLGL